MGEWRTFEHDPPPKDRAIYIKGPRGGKVRAVWTLGVLGLEGWATPPVYGESTLIGGKEWMPISRKPK